MNKRDFKPFDIVRSKSGSIGMITITNGERASVSWFTKEYVNEKNAWWDLDELEILGNAFEVITDEIAHPVSPREKQSSVFGF